MILVHLTIIAFQFYICSVSAMSVPTIYHLKFRELWVQYAKKFLVPPLTHANHKGQHGRIGIIGGSVDYSGAPFYAAQSALRFGADLSFVFCAKQAAGPIKSYSPELMVFPFYDADLLEDANAEVVQESTLILPIVV